MGNFIAFLKQYLKFLAVCFISALTIFGIVCVFANIGSFNQRLTALEDGAQETNMRLDWIDSRLDFCTRGD